MSTGESRQASPAIGKYHAETVARRYVREVVQDRNLDAVEALFAKPADWGSVSLVGGETVATTDELRRYYRQTLPSFEDVTVETVVADRSTAMVRWRAVGEVAETFPGIPAAGTTFETTAITEFGVSEAGIVSLHVQVNEMDLLPDVSWAAVQGLVEEMRDGVAVLDEDDRIVHVNPAATELFDRDREALLGEPVAALLGEGTCEPRDGDSHEFPEKMDSQATDRCAVATTDAGRHVSVGTSPLRDEDGNWLGRMVVVRDVTDRRRRVQQLAVLNRLLRHNLRNALQVAQGRLDTARDRFGEPVASLLAPARDQLQRLQARADTARQARAVLEDLEPVRQDLAPVAASVVEQARERYPSATVTATLPDAAPVEAPGAVEDALWELVANACEHAGDAPTVEVRVTLDREEVVLTVADDGPGVPAHERAALRRGSESDLDHASGIGLWLVSWVVDAAGGAFSLADDGGTTARISLPMADPGAHQEPRRAVTRLEKSA